MDIPLVRRKNIQIPVHLKLNIFYKTRKILLEISIHFNDFTFRIVAIKWARIYSMHFKLFIFLMNKFSF